MSRHAQRAKRVPSKRKDKFKSPRQAKTGPNWPVIIVVVAVVVVSVVVTLLLIHRHREATHEATPSTTVPTDESPGEMVPIEPSNTPTPVPTTPPPTSTPSPTATATPVPQSCQVLEATWVRAQPAEQSTGVAQLSVGDDVGVIGQIQDDQGKMWFMLAGYPGEAYVKAEMVQCHVP